MLRSPHTDGRTEAVYVAEPELISKKDLLQETGISYGQLYRWKRKRLIPEEWFVRKSTFTGQETFFPRDQVLTRVEKIKGLKDEDVSLDSIAEAVSPTLTEISMTPDEAVTRGIASAQAIDLYREVHAGKSALSFGELLTVYVLDRLLQAGEVSIDEGRILVRGLEETYPTCEGKPCDLVFVRKMGLSTCFLVTSSAELAFESGARVVTRLSLGESIEELKTRIR
jgi:DNA-binding transcriptional MerR regulator